MKIFAIGDLHFSFCAPVRAGEWYNIKQYKPMDVFGSSWQNHYQKIYDLWQAAVRDDDLVLVPGDISWGLTLAEASFDLDFLGSLPGTIVLVKGNHDYWWGSISRVRQVLPSNIVALQNDSFFWEEFAVCAARGWVCPGSEGFTAQDEKIFLREIQRLELSLKTVSGSSSRKKIVMMHFRPVNDAHEKNGFIELMERYQVETCVYGHLHNGAQALKLPETKWGINFFLVSADYTEFKPRLIWAGN